MTTLNDGNKKAPAGSTEAISKTASTAVSGPDYTTKLPARVQAQLICDKLNGFSVQAKARDFESPYAECWQAIQDKADKGAMIAALGQALDIQNRPENAKVLTRFLEMQPGQGSIPALADIESDIPAVEWLWENFIPRGYVTVLGAMQGAGKTALMQDIARRVMAKGEHWPDGTPIPNPGANVFYLDAEGMPEAIKERAIAWKMDRKKFFYKYPKDGEIFDLGQDKYRDMVYQSVYRVQPELIFIDSLGSINSKGENNIEDVRAIFSFLVMLAREFKAGLILSHHLRKRAGMTFEGTEITLDDFRGSGHITQMARSVLAVSVIQTSDETDRNGPRKLEVVKTNLGPYPEALGFEFVSGFPKGFVLRWGDAPRQYKAPTKEDACATWLQEVLFDEPLSLKEVVELGKSEDYSQGTIIRTRKKLGNLVLDTKGKRDPENRWRLAINLGTDEN